MCEKDKGYYKRIVFLWKPYSLGITEALGQLREQDFLQGSFCQLVTAVTAPHIHRHRIALGARTSCVGAA